MINKKKIIEEIEKRKEYIKKYDVKKIGLFGSYTKGTHKKDSDIDFIIEFNKLNADNYFAILFLLERIFKKKIDLVIESDLKPELSYVKKEAEYVTI